MQLKVNEGMPADLSAKELEALAKTAAVTIAHLMNDELDISKGSICLSVGFVNVNVDVNTLRGFE
jgi:hypothetical protein